MDQLKYVTYCGLHCKLCSILTRIPQQASALQQTMRNGGWEDFGEYALTGFKEFWTALDRLANTEKTCPGCRGGCGDPDCAIRQCAQSRNMEVCSACPDFPCDKINAFAEKLPWIIAEATRQKEIGLDAWIKLQEARCAAGQCYDDMKP